MPMIALAGGAVALAAVGFFATGAITGHHGAFNSSGPTHWPRTTGPHPSQGRSGGPGSYNGGHRHGGGRAAVSPTIGLRPGVASPLAGGFAAAMAALPHLSVAQLAGQRVIYSYRGLEPPALLLRLISRGEAAGVIFFSDNVGSTAHLAQVVAELQKADASSLNPLRGYPLLLMTDQEGGYVRRLPGPPYLSEKQVGQSADPSAAATAAGASAAAALRGAGLNVNLAPVLDVYRQPGDFIDQYGRSFSADAATVAELGQLYAAAE